jgi:hypothetical protein
MSRIGDAASSSHAQTDVFQGQVDSTRAHQEVLRGLDGKQACPFCGTVSERSSVPCQRCGMDNTPEARKATKARIGPWYVLQARNPAAPGMRFETLLSFVRKGRVRARSVVRGPTTHQLWRFAAHVKGLSREFGLCFSCGSAIEPTANICPQCNRLQEPPVNPDVLLENEGDEFAAPRAPIYRELPNPETASVQPVPQPAAPAPEAQPEPQPEEVDIIIPALGGFGLEESETKFSEAPVASAPAPVQDAFSSPATAAPAPARSADRHASPPPRAPADVNPFAMGAGRRRGNGGDAASFLSAKELAAAFKLSFDPGANMDSVEVPDQMPANALPEGMRPGAIVPRNPMALATQAAGPAILGRRRGGLRKFALFVLILAATGFGVLMWVDPGSRDKTIEWAKQTYSKLHRYASGADTPTTDNAGVDAPSSVSDIPDPPAPAPEPDALAEKPDASPTINVQVEPASPVDPVKESPSPRPAPVEAAPVPILANSGSAAEVSTDDSDANFQKMSALRREARNAEGVGDWAGAVKAYEEIQKLPRKDWPAGLEISLKLAREQRDKK